MPLDKVRKVLKISKEPVSLEKPVGDEEDSSLGDFIEDTKALAPLEQAIKSNLSEATTKILSTLTPREERVLRMRFGVGMNTDHTLEEVGLQFSVTRERIRQIEAKALRKLKHPSRSKQLKKSLGAKFVKIDLMLQNKIDNYFFILFSIIPISIIIGSSVSLVNILLIDLSFIIFLIYKKNFSFLKNKTLKLSLFFYLYLIFNSFYVRAFFRIY